MSNYQVESFAVSIFYCIFVRMKKEEWIAMTIEEHPLTPFLPSNSRILFLGSFPPPRNRWCMDFFYPNWINDFWRVMGLLFFEDKKHFEVPNQKEFDRQAIVLFAQEQGFAFFDTAQKVCRQRDNASDNFAQPGPMSSYNTLDARITVRSALPVSPPRVRAPSSARPIATPACGIRARPR